MKNFNSFTKIHREMGFFQAMNTKIRKNRNEYWKIRRKFANFESFLCQLTPWFNFFYSNWNDFAGLSLILIDKIQYQAIKSNGSVVQTTSIWKVYTVANMSTASLSGSKPPIKTRSETSIQNLSSLHLHALRAQNLSFASNLFYFKLNIDV